MAEKFMEKERKALEKFLRREMPVIAGRMAQDHFQNNFRLGGFVNGGLHPWPKSKRLSSGGTGAAGNYGTLLSERKVLFKSIKYIPADYRVKISNDVVYAPIHNWGDTVHPAVTDKMRKWAWRQFYKSAGIRKNASKKNEGVAVEGSRRQPAGADVERTRPHPEKETEHTHSTTAVYRGERGTQRENRKENH